MKHIILTLFVLFLLVGCVPKERIYNIKILPSTRPNLLAPVTDDYVIQRNYQYEHMKSSCVVVYNGLYMGSGAIIYNDDKFSYIITDQHVVGDSNIICVALPDEINGISINGKIIVGNVIDSNKDKDIALIRVSKLENSHASSLEKKVLPPVLSNVYSMGFPCNRTLMITKGVISRYCMFRNRLSIQVDAATYCGGSGGPVFIEDGRIIGIVDAMIESDTDVAIPNFNLVTSSYEISKWLEQGKFSFVLNNQK